MKLIIYLSIIFYVLIGIKGEPPSVSFFNLIPNLISVGQNLQNNVEFNQTLPSINLDVQLNANVSNCSQNFQLLIRDLASRKTWALKTLDAWGKVPSGIMLGNMYWIGSVYECKHRLHGWNNSVIDQPFRTRTCVVGDSYPNINRPIYGICVPQSCNANDIFNYINHRTIRIPFLQVTNDSIRCIDHRPYNTTAILTIVLLSIIAFLILIATGMHISYGHKYDLKMDDVPSAGGYEPILSRTTTATATSITTNTATTTTIETSLPTEDENTPLVVQPTRAVDSVALKLINCCSLINNYHVLKHENEPRNLACLNGIRVFSMWWVILGHTFLFPTFYSDNVMTLLNWSRQFWFQIVVQGVFSIDSFFLLSGLLTTFLFFISKTENEKFSILKFLLNHYIYRYLRYTIFYAIMLLIYITLSPYFGQGGPVYPVDGTETSTCRRTWWRNLLYINNFFDMSDGCMPVTWFLAVYMQFHWIAPLFLLATYWKWFVGLFVAFIFILVDIITTSVLVSKYNYDHGALSDFYKNGTNTTHNYMNDIYIKPWCRISPYAVGLIVGYILYELYQRSNTLSWESILPQRRANRLKQIIGWIFALIILGLCVFGTYGDYHGHPLTRSGRIAFLTLSRLGWAIGLSIIITSCFVGYGGIINKFLGHSVFESLSKLTYGAYLWHTLILFVNYLGREQPYHFTIANILFSLVIHIILSYILSFFTYIFIELPIIQLLKLAFKRRTVDQN